MEDGYLHVLSRLERPATASASSERTGEASADSGGAASCGEYVGECRRVGDEIFYGAIINEDIAASLMDLSPSRYC